MISLTCAELLLVFIMIGDWCSFKWFLMYSYESKFLLPSIGVESNPTLLSIWFKSSSEFNAKELEFNFKEYLEKKELGFGVAMTALRLSITGVGGGPSLFNIAEIIGKTETLKRLQENPDKIIALKS